MIYQRLYLGCLDGRADALETAIDAGVRPGFVRLARSTYTRAGKSYAVASLQATDDEAAALVAALAPLTGVVLLRGPDDDGPRALDALVDVGDAVPTNPTRARRTWRRIVADLGLEVVPLAPPSLSPDPTP